MLVILQITKFMKQILDDLIKNLTSNQWRVRESSCLALNDLLRGRPLDDIVEFLPSLWEICFRVRDDIKVRLYVALLYYNAVHLNDN